MIPLYSDPSNLNHKIRETSDLRLEKRESSWDFGESSQYTHWNP